MRKLSKPAVDEPLNLLIITGHDCRKNEIQLARVRLQLQVRNLRKGGACGKEGGFGGGDIGKQCDGVLVTASGLLRQGGLQRGFVARMRRAVKADDGGQCRELREHFLDRTLRFHRRRQGVAQLCGTPIQLGLRELQLRSGRQRSLGGG